MQTFVTASPPNIAHGIVQRNVIPPQHGVAFELKRGEVLTVADPSGQQVADLFCFDAHDLTDALSSGRSIDYNETISLTAGHTLYSNSGRALLQIVEDTCGEHDFLVTPCSLQMFQMMSGTSDYHRSCHENLVSSLATYGIPAERITTTFNIFMRVDVALNGTIRVMAPHSKAGDFIRLQAERDLIVGLTACSDEGTNAGRCKPIQFDIRRANARVGFSATSPVA